ncbi:MAG TPA: MarR family transcriptional regulator [Burkholderiales bacterium]|jgi:DNA-binding MarR family transcriptional regulator|nr:MarR family transcriptional regulator [Burkholderiales bacterium]
MAKSASRPRAALTDDDYERLAAFRHAVRQFLHFSESVASGVGLTGQQYQAMLAIRSMNGRGQVTINDLARQLLIRHNSAVGLVDRLVAQGLMIRERVPEDRRKARLKLSPKGEQLLGRLASVHRVKLNRIGPDIHRILSELAGAWRRER